jgi:hypothetical protein
MKRRKTREGTFIELEEGDLRDETYTHRLPVGKRARGPGGKRITIEISAEATELLGKHGRLLSASKTHCAEGHPGHEIYFNACIFEPGGGTEIWFGDLDLTLDKPKLEELAERVGQIIVTPEHPYRFEGLEGACDDDQVIAFNPRAR